MEATIDTSGAVPVIVLSGRLDTVAAPVFDAQMTPFLAEARPRILMDLAGVAYISSAGLRSILQLVKHTAAHGGRLGLFAVPASIQEVIEISGFPSLLDVYPDHESAVKGSAA